MGSGADVLREAWKKGGSWTPPPWGNCGRPTGSTPAIVQLPPAPKSISGTRDKSGQILIDAANQQRVLGTKVT